MRKTLPLFAMLSAAALTACQPGTAPTPPAQTPPAPAGDVAPPPAPATPPAPAPATDPRSVLVGKVWRVTQRSDAAPAGATYAFLYDGRLVVADSKSTPMTGSWTIKDGMLSMIEEGVTYPTGLVVTDADHVKLRSYNPTGVLDLTLERAKDVRLPD